MKTTKPQTNREGTYVYGIHAVMALLNSARRTIQALYVNKERIGERLEELLNAASRKQIPLTRLTASEMNQRFSQFKHQGVVASASALSEYTERDLLYLLKQCSQPSLILILDGITDPHNLGACLRSADGAGVDFVIIPKDKNAPSTPTVSKVASGALESIPLIRVTNLSRTMEALKQHGVWIYGAAGEAKASLYELDFKPSIALALGAEDNGLRRLTRDQCDALFSLPMRGIVSSLNVSVATGVCLYEVQRQRAGVYTL